jgi:type I restriction enzyme M protein
VCSGRIGTGMADNHSRQIVQKLWNYCNVLRDDGLSYGDYV